jgi:hypothetical protein
MPLPPVEQERIISGRGTIRLNDDFKECKRILLYASVVRKPKSEYNNTQWSPDKGFYANLTFIFKDYVGLQYAMNFDQQFWTVHDNNAQQLGASLVCALENILDSFVQYAISQGIPYTKNNSIKGFAYSAFVYEAIRFRCYGGCALSLRLVGEKTEKCDENDAPSDYPPPPPPPTQPDVPPGTPIDVSPPYTPNTDDGGATIPDIDDSDQIPEPTCNQRILNYTIINPQFPTGLTGDIQFEGEFEGFERTEGGNLNSTDLGFRASKTINNQCVPGQYYSLAGNLDNPVEVVANSITDL